MGKQVSRNGGKGWCTCRAGGHNWVWNDSRVSCNEKKQVEMTDGSDGS